MVHTVLYTGSLSCQVNLQPLETWSYVKFLEVRYFNHHQVRPLPMSTPKSSVSHPVSGQEMVEWPRHLGDPAKEKSWDTFGLGLGGFIYMVGNHFHVRMSPCRLPWCRNVLQQHSYQPLGRCPWPGHEDERPIVCL